MTFVVGAILEVGVGVVGDNVTFTTNSIPEVGEAVVEVDVKIEVASVRNEVGFSVVSVSVVCGFTVVSGLGDMVDIKTQPSGGVIGDQSGIYTYIENIFIFYKIFKISGAFCICTFMFNKLVSYLGPLRV